MNAQLNGHVPSAPSLRVLQALEDAGLEAWYVGGWVRDALMGRPSHDVDMCCSGTWQQNAVALEAADIYVIESGVKFGGITAVADGERIEVTAYREDGFYTDGRHPEEVRRVTTVEADLARRDFTVNAMAWHPARGLLDLYDGEGDLQRRLIRAVGEPRRRFEEDALRMLRAVRFACRLGFTIEPCTAAALASCAPLLDAVARERVGMELTGILATRRAGEAMTRYPELMCAAIPELSACRGFDQKSVYHDSDVYDHIARVLSGVESMGNVAQPPEPALAWAALLHDIAKPACFTVDDAGHGHFYGHPEAGAKAARSIMRRLGMPDRLIKETCLLVRYHDRRMACKRSKILGLMRLLSVDGMDAPSLVEELFDLMCADALGKAPQCHGYVDEIERMRMLARELVAAGEAYSLKTLAINGGDLIRAGVAPGRDVGDLLGRALDAEISGAVSNDRSALLAYLGLA